MSTPSPEQPTTADLPGFLPPSPKRSRRTSTPSPSSSTDPTPAPDEAADYLDSPFEGAAPTTSTETSSPASTEGPAKGAVPRLIDAKTRQAYAAIIAIVARTAGGLATSRLDPEGGAFLMADDEAEAIAAPASRLLARRAPLPTGPGGATDAADVVELITACIGYAIAAIGRKAAGGAGDPVETAIPQDAGPAPVPAPTPAAPSMPWPVPSPAPAL